MLDGVITVLYYTKKPRNYLIRLSASNFPSPVSPIQGRDWCPLGDMLYLRSRHPGTECRWRCPYTPLAALAHLWVRRFLSALPPHSAGSTLCIKVKINSAGSWKVSGVYGYFFSWAWWSIMCSQRWSPWVSDKSLTMRLKFKFFIVMNESMSAWR